MLKPFTLFTIILLINSCNGQYLENTNITNMNKLSYSSSPYLQQHANNPVHWQEWGEEALSMAKELNKPLIISIGYAACHWCHVMEHESFSNEEVAAFMNDNFICIKVDREERPDIDLIYMDAVHLINGQGGWPLNAFALPDGKPFFAGTYFSRQKWMDVMKQIVDLYKNENSKVVGYANELTMGINKNPLKVLPDIDSSIFSRNAYSKLKDQWLNQIDFKNGGFSRAPKFPLPTSWEFLLQYYYFTKDNEALEAVELTLDEMAKGGIYDQIGGGFARYSVDSYWKVPHFEKMLYDNAQLVSLYSHAYQINQNPRYKEIIEQTLSFIEREMTDDNGGFYSSLNADSEGVEGKFYVWTLEEISSIVNHDYSDLIIDYYQISKQGNWEHGNNILLPEMSKKEFASKNNIEVTQLNSILTKVNNELFTYREKRERPSTDDKILTSWNSLMIIGYIDAYKALGNEDYLDKAVKNANFLSKEMLSPDGSLLRNFMKNKASIDAFHDDYALFAEACLELYGVTFDKHWLVTSELLVEYCMAHFYDDKSGMYYYTSDLSESLVARKYELSDNVISSSNSIMANVLYKLSHYVNNKAYIDIAYKMIHHEIENIQKSGIWYSNWANLFGLMSYSHTEVAIMGPDYKSVLNMMQKNYLPASLFLGGVDENLPLLADKLTSGTMIYVCRNKTCNLPVVDPTIALEQISFDSNQHQ